jgi:hypothetical protein
MAVPPGQRQSEPSPSSGSSAKMKLAVTGSAVLLLVIGALVTPIGNKLVNLVWPERLPSSTTAPDRPAIAAVSTDGCVANGPALSVTMTYDFTGARWWATKDKLPDDIASRLDGANDPSTVLAPYNAVEMEWSAGTPLKLVVTGCGPNTVTITNMHAAVSKRAEPLAGSVVLWPPQGSFETIALALDLDSPEPAALTYDSLSGTRGGAYFVEHAVRVAPDETVPFEIFGQTARSYVEWTLTIDALVGGRPWQFTVKPPGGDVVRSTAAPTGGYQSAYLFSNVTRRYGPTDPVKSAARLGTS